MVSPVLSTCWASVAISLHICGFRVRSSSVTSHRGKVARTEGERPWKAGVYSAKLTNLMVQNCHSKLLVHVLTLRHISRSGHFKKTLVKSSIFVTLLSEWIKAILPFWCKLSPFPSDDKRVESETMDIFTQMKLFSINQCYCCRCTRYFLNQVARSSKASSDWLAVWTCDQMSATANTAPLQQLLGSCVSHYKGKKG